MVDQTQWSVYGWAWPWGDSSRRNILNGWHLSRRKMDPVSERLELHVLLRMWDLDAIWIRFAIFLIEIFVCQLSCLLPNHLCLWHLVNILIWQHLDKDCFFFFLFTILLLRLYKGETWPDFTLTLMSFSSSHDILRAVGARQSGTTITVLERGSLHI